VLGLDLGTSRLKALLCAADGTVLGRGTAGYQVSAPREGWAETDPEQWWQATRTAVGSALGPARAQVVGIAVAGQMHGLVLYAEPTGVLRPAILWLDRRSADQLADYHRLAPELLARLGNAPSAGMAGPILLWLSRHEPDAYRQADWMLQPKDWLRLRLTGEAATDPTDASGTLLFDLARDNWATDVAQALGLRTDLLPAIRGPGEIAGRLQPAVADELGLPPGLPVATGAADTAASLLAAQLTAADGRFADSVPARAQATGPAEGLLTLGTGGQLIVPLGPAATGLAIQAGPSRTTNLFRAVGGGTYRLAAAQNVGVTLDWARRVLGASWDELYGTAGWPWQEGTPVFLPYLVGERWDDRGAGGAWSGLTLAHRRDDLLRAALEGVAFLLRGKLDDLRAEGCVPAWLRLAGGGSAHPAWRQLLADALAVPLHPGGDGWLTARGATTIAATATGMRSGQRRPPRVTKAERSAQKPEIVIGRARLAEPSYRRFRSSASARG
jgi:xylulokinase